MRLKISSRTFLIVLLSAVAMVVFGITEDENQVGLRDANSSRERPRLENFDMDEDVEKEIETSKEEFNFNADVSRLMDIIINSLYTKKEVFIRELISNASDALDKVRFVSVQNPEYLGNIPQLEIMIDFDFDAKTISITDTGIGMTKAELIKNLGTVAKSGTTAFLEAIGKGDSLSLIGQFGVGFYSAFLVANKVVVSSKANDDEQHVWTSTADAKFFVTKDPRGDTLGRGTRVTLHLKDDAIEYVEQDKIKNLVKKYSEFIQYPIKLFLSKEVRKQVPDEEEKPAETTTEETKQDDAEIKDEGETKPTEEETPKEPKTKTVTEQVWEWDTINEVKAIWLREKSDITEDEYSGFYKTITKDHEAPLTYTHFTAEGEIEFKAILFIPSNAPYDLFENYYGKSSALKLYVRRVLITEEFEELMPRYLNFIKGVVDSDDLPLNVSREQLQQLKMIKVMSKKLIRKAIEMIKALAEEDEEDDDEDDEDNEESTDESKEEESEDEKKDTEKKDEEDKYGKFWKNFGKNIKLGVIEDASNRSKLAKLLRFYSTHDTEKLISLDEYISRMKPDQDTILYLPGDSKEGILKSPILKKYQKSGYEVLLLGDPIDEFCVQHLSEYEKRKVKSIAKDDVNILDGSDEISKKKLQKLKEMYKPLTEWFKKTLGKEVEKVIISNKLEDDPVYILTSQYGYSAQMEKINRAQAFANQEKAASHMLAKKTLELNPHHPVIKEMLTRVKGAIGGEIDDSVKEYAILLYNMALLNSGFLIENPADFIAPMQKLLKVGFGMKSDAPVEEIEVDISSEEEAATEQEQESPEEPDVAGEVEEEDTKRNEEL